MLGLFNKYKDSGQEKKALLVGHNMMNRNPDDLECFEAYFDYLLKLANDDNNHVATYYLQQATGALAFFSESASINENLVEFIIKKENELNEATKIIEQKKEENHRDAIKQRIKFNEDALDLLERLLDKIDKCTTQADFNKYISDMEKIDKSIVRESLSKRQEDKYVELSHASSNIVSNKISYFEKINNRDYNIKAIESFENVFNMFKSGKVDDNHKEILKSMFSYDTSRLYNETLVYYNHVYNYILGKLNDKEKFTITKYAIMSERDR